MTAGGERRAAEHWTPAEAYELRVGRWSRLVALEFVEWLALPAGARWLDVGCGTGVLCQAILESATPARVVGVDAAEDQLALARERVVDPRTDIQPGNAESLPFPDGAFDAAVSGLVLNFVTEPAQALAESVRVVQPGGSVAAYLWDFAEGMQMMRTFWDAATALDPAAAEWDQGKRFLLCKPEPLHALFSEAGLARVEIRAIDVATIFRDFEDYWAPMTSGTGSIPSYYQSLGRAGRAGLEQRLRETLPIASDGRIRLEARAWAVRGLRSP